MGNGFDDEFEDVRGSGAIVAVKRPGLATRLACIRKGDRVHV